MVSKLATIDVSDLPEMTRLAKAVAADGQPRLLQAGGADLAILSPVRARRRAAMWGARPRRFAKGSIVASTAGIVRVDGQRLSTEDERAAFEKGVAEEAAESLGGQMAEDLPFIDANIFLRHFTQDHPDHSPRATAFLMRVESGDQRARSADTVVFETVFLLERTYHEPRTQIRDILLPLLLPPSIVLPNKRRMRRTFRLYVSHPKLSFADCYHVAQMEGLGLSVMVSFDRKVSQARTITRKEPDGRGQLP